MADPITLAALALLLGALIQLYYSDHDAEALRQGFLQTLREHFDEIDVRDIDPADKTSIVNAAVGAQAHYLSGFIYDLEQNKISPAQAHARAAQYATSLENLRNEIEITNAPMVSPWRWEYAEEVQHCGDCLALDGEVRSAREWRALGLWPRSLKTECGGNCKCRLRRLEA